MTGTAGESQSSPGLHRRILITVSGPDQPGITAALTGVIADGGVEIADMEQVVVQGLLSLSIVLEFSGEETSQQPVLKELLFAAKELGLELDFKVLPADTQTPAPCRSRGVVSLIGNPVLQTRAVARVTRQLADNGFNIETIQRLNQGSLHCLEMVVSAEGGDPTHALQHTLAPVGREFSVDIAVQPDTLFRMMKRLVIFDLDSTLIQVEIIDELAEEAGIGEQVRAITAWAMNGEMPFQESLRRRVALLKGLEVDRLEAVYNTLQFTSGAERLIHTLKQLGYRTGIISGGFTYFTDRIRDRLALDYAFANELEIDRGKLTGRLVGPIIDGEAKAQLLEQVARDENVRLEQVIAIGDGANDLPMLARAGLGIAFNAKPQVRDAAEHALNQRRLDTILFLLGITQEDIEALEPGA